MGRSCFRVFVKLKKSQKTAKNYAILLSSGLFYDGDPMSSGSPDLKDAWLWINKEACVGQMENYDQLVEVKMSATIVK